MGNGAIIGDIDVAQLLVVAFVIFFFGLVLYLRREDKREGYPLVDPAGGSDGEGFPPMPEPKLFLLREGGVATAPHPEVERPLEAVRAFPFPGSSLDPTGDPLVDGVGPAVWSATRRDAPLWYAPGVTQLTPLRAMSDWRFAKGDTDLRGLPVVDRWGAGAGVVRDIWFDRGVKVIRYLEVEADGGGRTLLPIHHTDLRRTERRVGLRGISAKQVAGAPPLADPDVVTAREEDRICAFYAGARFYNAETTGAPARLAPWERGAERRRSRA